MAERDDKKAQRQKCWSGYVTSWYAWNGAPRPRLVVSQFSRLLCYCVPEKSINPTFMSFCCLFPLHNVKLYFFQQIRWCRDRIATI